MEITAPLMVTIPHSGEKIPPQTPWLNALPEEIVMCDVDRYVDFLYEPTLHKLQIPFVKTEWHRYAADMNRVPEDVDSTSVIGNKNPAGMHNRGFHWVITTYKHPLMKEPMTQQAHDELVKLIYEPFHNNIRDLYGKLHQAGYTKTFHIDAHSMPSVGTSEHRDPGERRADIVVSDSKGKSCDPRFKDLVIAAYVTAGFKVGYNWPYFGGRVTEQYGDPSREMHTLQVEMNRELYMDEKTKKLKPEEAKKVQEKIAFALSYIRNNLKHLM
ncbi:N-formylglutamate amidohydrolase [Bdellovibrio sp. SKB1291214]|uniref:N-formylglutamate amidohydrolase n=1 Tax=Bdellovibrio sp. SKB1291214 TaxID=1732569 RepID=UPI000B51503C|nr:N-formylglutamate amidohydrolase [Bdellovibrio sp. SKB1291214]UYL08427.1 N-formylglutamate amidohydrolase [Bdellovibrio sp. SKB1291214]